MTALTAYLLKGDVPVLGNSPKTVRLVVMQKPYTSLKNRFLKNNSDFYEITDIVLNLRTSFDAMIYENVFYMFTFAAEGLFNMEKSYKKVCLKKVEEIIECDFLTDYEIFKSIATKGHYPRKFVSFNQERLELLKNNESREGFANKFNIPLYNGKFDVTHEGTSEKILKILCNKGMIDPFNDTPVEVDASRKWR